MKTIENITLKEKNESVTDAATGAELDSCYLIRTALSGNSYKSTSDQFRAYDLWKKLEDFKGDKLEFEDSEYTLVKQVVDSYEPFKNGLKLVPFKELFKG